MARRNDLRPSIAIRSREAYGAHVRRRRIGTICISRSTIAAFMMITACAGPSTPTRRIDVAAYGDSLLTEARAPMVAGLRRGSTIVRGEPGRAPCDLVRTLRTDLARYRPHLVMLETVGDALTPCIRDRGAFGSRAHVDATLDDVEGFVDVARDAGAKVLLVAPPPIGGRAARDNRWVSALGLGLTRIAGTRRGVSAVQGPRTAVAPDGVFAATLPCLPDEAGRPDCHTGRIAARDPYFGIHFCPVGYPDDAAIFHGCAVYSSGARRFGRALAAAIGSSLGAPRG